jgi:hypothetical protein
MSLPPTKFEDASRIEPLGSHEYAIKVHPDFAWGTVAHGGYLFSLLWKAIAEHYRTTLKSYDQPDTVAMHVELLRPVPLGEAVIQIKDVRLGKGSRCTLLWYRVGRRGLLDMLRESPPRAFSSNVLWEC